MISDLRYKTVSAGSNLSIALTENGKIVYWGDSQHLITEGGQSKHAGHQRAQRLGGLGKSGG